MTLEIDSNIALTSSVTDPNNVNIEIGSGGVIALGNYNLGINGNFSCPPNRKAFSYTGSGVATFGAGAVKEAYAEWWGGSSSVDSAAAIGYLIESFGTNGGTWKIISPLRVDSSLIISKDHINILGSTAGAYAGGDRDLGGSYLDFSNASDPNIVALTIGNVSDTVFNTTVKNIGIMGYIGTGLRALNVSDCVFDNLKFSRCRQCALDVKGCNDSKFRDLYMTYCGGYNPDLGILTVRLTTTDTHGSQKLVFDNIHIESCYGRQLYIYTTHPSSIMSYLYFNELKIETQNATPYPTETADFTYIRNFIQIDKAINIDFKNCIITGHQIDYAKAVADVYLLSIGSDTNNRNIHFDKCSFGTNDDAPSYNIVDGYIKLENTRPEVSFNQCSFQDDANCLIDSNQIIYNNTTVPTRINNCHFRVYASIENIFYDWDYIQGKFSHRNNHNGNINYLDASIGESNKGIITERGASGTASITSGNTYVDVSHGLDYTPDQRNILVTLRSNLGSAGYYYVSNIEASTIRINLNVDPVATVSFAWHILSDTPLVASATAGMIDVTAKIIPYINNSSSSINPGTKIFDLTGSSFHTSAGEYRRALLVIDYSNGTKYGIPGDVAASSSLAKLPANTHGKLAVPVGSVLIDPNYSGLTAFSSGKINYFSSGM